MLANFLELTVEFPTKAMDENTHLQNTFFSTEHMRLPLKGRHFINMRFMDHETA